MIFLDKPGERYYKGNTAQCFSQEYSVYFKKK